MRDRLGGGPANTDTPQRLPASHEPARESQPDEPGAFSPDIALEERVDDQPATLPTKALLTERLGILIFTARPGSIASGGPTELCYAVREAVEVRIEPGIGEVAPAGTLKCLRVAPSRTTTYTLTAHGTEGDQARQQLVIIVR